VKVGSVQKDAGKAAVIQRPPQETLAPPCIRKEVHSV
jgi:hypothetical protein